MPKKTTPYTYRQEDDPIDLAKRFAIPPDALLSANPGGTPFSTGQVINIPQNSPYFQSEKQTGLGPFIATTPMYYNPINKTAGATGSAFLGQNAPPVGFGGNFPASSPVVNPRGGTTDDSWYAPATNAQPPGIQPTPAGNTDFNMTQAAQYNAKNNIPFLQQKRWDPQRRKYITVGEWLRRSQGQRRRDRRAQNQANNRVQQEQQQVDYTLANSLVNFGVSAG